VVFDDSLIPVFEYCKFPSKPLISKDFLGIFDVQLAQQRPSCTADFAVCIEVCLLEYQQCQ
jgi:hypothetical protein